MCNLCGRRRQILKALSSASGGGGGAPVDSSPLTDADLPMDVQDSSKFEDMDIDMNVHTENVHTDIGAAMDMSSVVYAARTKPVHLSHKKRVGAKQSKKLEIDPDGQFNLSPADATTYRALAARCNYLSQDRFDISFSAKELCREFAVPSTSSFIKLKRLVRYLTGLPRLVYDFKFGTEVPDVIDIYVDTDFAGCQSTRRSTSGGGSDVGPLLH